MKSEWEFSSHQDLVLFQFWFWLDMKLKALISQRFDFISSHEKFFDLILQEKASVLILFCLISWLLNLILQKKISHSDFVSFRLMKDWFHFMKMWSHSSFISSHFTEAWSHFSSDLRSEWNEIFWSQLNNTDYMMQKEQRVLSNNVINTLLSHILIMLLN